MHAHATSQRSAAQPFRTALAIVGAGGVLLTANVAFGSSPSVGVGLADEAEVSEVLLEAGVRVVVCSGTDVAANVRSDEPD